MTPTRRDREMERKDRTIRLLNERIEVQDRHILALENTLRRIGETLAPEPETIARKAGAQ